MDKIHFLFGVHNHQPIGNFEFVFEKAYQRAYLPFLEAMERHPCLAWNLHAAGILWDWFQAHHPDYIERIAQQVDEGRLELLTGGFYEPILPALPDVDKIGQIQKLTRYLRKQFRCSPTGMWLAERVWEPSLPKVLKEAGIRYTLLDDSHFFMTGMNEDQMTGAYLSEDQGAAVTILPIRQDLRYAIPFKDPGETLTLLRRYGTPTGSNALVMIDDGEKFGLWPGTNKHVYQDGWLERFLTVLESNADWILCSRISDYLKQTGPRGGVYLPAASYYEMSEWTLPAEAQESLHHATQALKNGGDQERAKQFLRGGYWRNFLSKYEESNNLHKKMLWVSQKVHRILSSHRGQKMLDALWAGQCNCAYWHGVFGGLYLPHLRQAIYRHLIEAETLADRALHAQAATVTEKDINLDGRTEVLMESPTQNLYVNPHDGGSIFEWDLRAGGINLLNVLTRRREGYHQQLLEYQRSGGGSGGGGVKTIHELVRVKEPGLDKYLHVDWYRRASLLDHFFHPNTTIDDFYRCQYGEQGDFIKAVYAVKISRDENFQVHLSRTGTVWAGEQGSSLHVEKTLSFIQPLGWQVAYRIQNSGDKPCQTWFGSEMVFAFSSQDTQDPVEHPPKTFWKRRDHGFGLVVKLLFDQPMACWEFPLETVSLSEEGFERTYQGTVLLAHHPLSLEPGGVENRSWRVEVFPE